MEYRFLGNSGLAVSELCLGAMTFGNETDEPASHELLDRFVEAGGNFVDTADVYADGASEEIIGRWLALRSRDDMSSPRRRSGPPARVPTITVPGASTSSTP